jgi:hypothetical protein
MGRGIRSDDVSPSDRRSPPLDPAPPAAFLHAVERIINRIEQVADGENAGAVCYALAFELDGQLEKHGGHGAPGRVGDLRDRLVFLMQMLAGIAAEYPDSLYTRGQ